MKGAAPTPNVATDINLSYFQCVDPCNFDFGCNGGAGGGTTEGVRMILAGARLGKGMAGMNASGKREKM